MSLFEISIYLIIGSIILMVIGGTAQFNWEGGREDWWGIFLPIGMLLFFAGIICMIIRIFWILAGDG